MAVTGLGYEAGHRHSRQVDQPVVLLAACVCLARGAEFAPPPAEPLRDARHLPTSPDGFKHRSDAAAPVISLPILLQAGHRTTGPECPAYA
jgi:hypothetical protein